MNAINLNAATHRRFDKGWPLRPLSRLHIYWLLLSTGIVAFILDYLIGGSSAALTFGLGIASSVTCGLSWLLARELFQPEGERARWPVILVGLFFAMSVALITARTNGLSTTGPLGFMASITALIGSAVLLMPFFEALDSKRRKLSSKERKFRAVFVSGYGLILGTALIVGLPELAGIERDVQVGLSVLALLGFGLAVRHRSLHTQSRPQRTTAAIPSNPHLKMRIQTLLETDRIYLDPALKVSDMAHRLGCHEYKVSRCITGDLGFRNFNHMVNAYRIAEAKKRLTHPAYADCSILTIAMDSGFSSIGPFNRAFKAETGMTPGAYRRQQPAHAD